MPFLRLPRPRRLFRRFALAPSVATAVAAAIVTAGAPRAAAAQQPDTLRAGVTTIRDTVPRVILPQPPISPRRAFLTSFLLPGYGQARLDRPKASALFFGVEAGSALMLAKTLRDLRFAERHVADSVPATFAVDAETGQVRRDAAGAPIVATWSRTGRYPAELVRARRLQREDWIAVLVFNHLFAGADAFVAAHLWDVPAAVLLSADGTGRRTISASLRW